jgi:hypothetical protein
VEDLTRSTRGEVDMMGMMGEGIRGCECMEELGLGNTRDI